MNDDGKKDQSSRDAFPEQDTMSRITHKRKMAAMEEITRIITYWNEHPTEEAKTWESEQALNLAKKSDFVLETYGSSLRHDEKLGVKMRVRRSVFQLAIELEETGMPDLLFNTTDDNREQLMHFYNEYQVKRLLLDGKLASYVRNSTWSNKQDTDRYLDPAVVWIIQACDQLPGIFPETEDMFLKRLIQRLDPYQENPFSILLLTHSETRDLQHLFTAKKLPMPIEIYDCDPSSSLFPRLYVSTMANWFQSRTIETVTVAFGRGDHHFEGIYHRRKGSLQPVFVRKELYSEDFCLIIANDGINKEWRLYLGAKENGMFMRDLFVARNSKQMMIPPSGGWERRWFPPNGEGYCDMRIRSASCLNHSDEYQLYRHTAGGVQIG